MGRKLISVQNKGRGFCLLLVQGRGKNKASLQFLSYYTSCKCSQLQLLRVKVTVVSLIMTDHFAPSFPGSECFSLLLDLLVLQPQAQCLSPGRAWNRVAPESGERRRVQRQNQGMEMRSWETRERWRPEAEKPEQREEIDRRFRDSHLGGHILTGVNLDLFLACLWSSWHPETSVSTSSRGLDKQADSWASPWSHWMHGWRVVSGKVQFYQLPAWFWDTL